MTRMLLIILIGVILICPSIVNAQNNLLEPYLEDSAHSPKLEIISPENNTLANGKIQLKMNVENFNLTSDPEESTNSGVIAIYVDGKFYENFASSSAQINLPRKGTHLIEAELTKVNRAAIVPRVSDFVYINNQLKTPYIYIKNVRNSITVFTEKPAFEIEYMPSVFEDTTGFIKVFIDGEVDGSTQENGNNSVYTVNNVLKEGKHSVRFVLYKENGAVYLPAVENSFSLEYSNKRPQINSVELPQNPIIGEKAEFKLDLQNFNPGEDGYVAIRAANKSYLFTETEGFVIPTFQGLQKLQINLLDNNGFSLKPEVKIERIIDVKMNKNGTANKNSLIPNGVFFTPENSLNARSNLIILAIIEAAAIIVFGVFLVRKHK